MQKRRVWRVLGVCAVISLLVGGCIRPPLGSPGSVAGTITVYDGFGVNPLDGALVMLEGTQLQAETDSEGRYEITGIPRGNYTVVALKDGLTTGRREGIVVAPGAQVRNVDMELTYTNLIGTLTGSVVDDLAGPVAGATVRITREDSVVASMQTDAQGEFEVEIVQGVYTVEVVKQWYKTATVADVTVVREQETSLGTLVMPVVPYFFDTFDEELVGERPSGWVTDFLDNAQYTNANNRVSVQELAGERAVRLGHSNANEQYVGDVMLRSFPPQEGRFEARFKFHPTGMDRSLYFGLSNHDHPTGVVATGISIAYVDGELRYYDGGWKTIAAMAPGSWYDVHLVVDVTTQTFDAYVDGVQTVTGGRFRTSVSAIKNIAFAYWRGSTDQPLPEFYVDDVCVGLRNCN